MMAKEMLISSRGNSYKVLLSPKVTNITYSENQAFTVFFKLNISYEGRAYDLPFKILYEKQRITAIDEETFAKLETKTSFIKKRDIDLNFLKYFQEHNLDEHLHVLIQSILLLFTFNTTHVEEIVQGNLPLRVEDNSFFLAKDDLLNNNRLVQYQVDACVLDTSPTTLDYIPKNCKLLKIYKPIFQGTVEQCEELIFNSVNLKALRKRKFEKFSRINHQGLPFNQLEAERDTFHAITDGQLGNFEDFQGDIDDIYTWAGK
jgi:hypothetical protein